jgi:hypothetical protein
VANTVRLNFQSTSVLDVPFHKIIDYWEAVTRRSTDLKMVRALALWDRYYLLVKICGRKDMLHPWLYDRCREVEREPDGFLDIWSREHYKDLADDTPMLTHNRGWTTHGDLRAGDYVFSPSGQPIRVLATTKRYDDSICYRIRFSDNSSLVAGSGHLWSVKNKHRPRFSGGRYTEFTSEVITTQQMIGRKRVNVGVAQPLVFLDESSLPISPYVLGTWLGDGSSKDGRIGGIDYEIFDFIKSEGYELSSGNFRDRGGEVAYRNSTIYGIRPILRKLNLLSNKHIPQIYMESSIEQRMELLRGLMDTDGHCNDRGTATFTNTNERLTDQVYHLAASLGLRPRLREYWSKFKGKPYQYFHVSFQAHEDRNPFKISRKARFAKEGPYRHRDTRRVQSVRRVPTVPTRCIQVEGDLYLAGHELIPTHNSTIITFGGIIQEILRNPEITIGIFSHTGPIAKAFLKQIREELKRNETLKRLFPDILYKNPEHEAPAWSVDNGIIVRRHTNPKEATVEAHGLVDGMPTSKHYQLRVYDDVVVQASVSTPEQVAKTTEAWELSDNLGTENGRTWHLGTRWSYADTYDAIIKKNVVKTRMYPSTDDGTFTGRPVLWSVEENDRRKVTQGEAVYSCQNLQNPLAGTQRMFNVEDLQQYEIRPHTLNTYILIDPARSKKVGSANTAMLVLGLDYAGNKYLLDGVNHKMDLQDRWSWMARLYDRWVRAPGVQNTKVGYEAFGAQADLDYFKEQMKLNKWRFDIDELKWPRDGEGSKIDRVQRLGPDIRSHRFYIPYNTDDKNLTMRQREMMKSGYDFRVARPIKRKDENGNLYDLSEQFKTQIHYFPFGSLKDLPDAASRIYDMEPLPPSTQEPRYLEPEYV